MGVLSGIFSGGDTIKGALEGAGGLARDIRTAVTGDADPEKLAEIEQRAQDLEAQAAQAQVELNKAEASSGSLFVAGWRPALGWTFAAIVGLHYLARPVAEWILQAAGHTDLLPLPSFDLTAIWPVLVGMLGFGGLRTVEKIRNVHGRH